MTSIKKITIGFLSCILTMGCTEEPKVELKRIEISSQADVDYVCHNLSGSDTFNGDIVIFTEEELDYKCLSKLRHVHGDLVLQGPAASSAFRDIESVLGDEVFSICDNAVDTMYFPRLKIVNAEISISSFCNFSNVLYIPNIESLGSIFVGTPSMGISRSGTFLGFDKLVEVFNLNFDSSNGLDDNIKIDGFSNLKRVLVEFRFNKFNKALGISQKSFNNLEEVARFNLVQGYDPNTHSDLILEYIFPKLKSSTQMELKNIDPEQTCYLKEYIASGDISLGVLNTMTNIFYGNESLLNLCE